MQTDIVADVADDENLGARDTTHGLSVVRVAEDLEVCSTQHPIMNAIRNGS